jgi:protoheme ferro-lyase
MNKFFLLAAGIPVFFLAGWLFIDALTVNPTGIFSRVFLFAVILCLSVLLVIFAAREKLLLGSVLTFLVFFMAGYLIHAKIYLSREDGRLIPEITRQPGPSKGHTAVVYFTHGEPETFSPIGWLNQFREFDQQGIRFVPFVARPFFINSLRHKYLEVGQSRHRQGHGAMVKSLETLYRQQGDSTTQFYISFLDDEPRPDAAVIRALNEGADRIVVATVFVSVSNHTAEGKHLVEHLDCENKYGVKLVFADPMWDSETLAMAFVDKVNARIGSTPKDQVAIALVGHGQPSEWDVEFPTETSQEIEFRDRIMEALISDGFKRENLGKAWMEFKEPKPYELMEHFVKKGVKKILFFAAAISAESIHSQADIPALVYKYPFPPDVEVINMGAWNDHPLVIRAIKEKIDGQLANIR